MSMRVERIVDLSVILDERTQTYPGDPEPSISTAARIESEGFNLLALHIGSQSGTHVDAPYHFIEDGPRLEDCDLSLFTGLGVIVDVTGHGDRQPITWDDLGPARPPRALRTTPCASAVSRTRLTSFFRSAWGSDPALTSVLPLP
ncbi:MAG: cyclase family protein, partial [Actinomycetota bacterium]